MEDRTSFGFQSAGGLRLYEIQPSDIDYIFKGLSDFRVYRYYGIRLLSREDAEKQMTFYRQLVSTRTGQWWSIRGSTSEFMGAIGVNDYHEGESSIEIGFWLLPEFWGKGVLRECIPFVEESARQQFSVNLLVAWVETENYACLKLLTQLGYRVVGTQPHAEMKDGQWIDLCRLEKKWV